VRAVLRQRWRVTSVSRLMLHHKVTLSPHPLGLTRSMPEVARCNTIEVDEAVVRAGSKIRACDQVEQALVGAISLSIKSV
jgi:hypothetical protein